jgi:streptogramin lyase
MKRSKPTSTTALLVIVAIGIAMLTPFLSAGKANAAPTINEYDIPTSGTSPWDITNGPDGGVWFTKSGGSLEESIGVVGRVTASGSFTEYRVPGSESDPSSITTGPDGRIWVTDYGQGRGSVYKLTTTGSFTGYEVNSTPCGITAGPDGNLWFAEHETGRIDKISTSGAVTSYPLPDKKSYPTEVVTGPDGNLWFVEEEGDKIGKVTTSGSFTEYTIPTHDCSPSGITAGPDGNLWFTEAAGNKIGRITTSGSCTEYPIPTSNSSPAGITAGSDGNLWFTERSGNKIGKITTSGKITEYAIPTFGSQPVNITSGPDGNLWFTEWEGNKIGQLVINPPVPPASQWKSAFYFAEGYTGANFQEYACLENPNASVADAWITCMFSDGTTKTQYYSLAPSSRLTVDINQLAGANRELSLRIVSTSAAIVAERPMYFNYNGTWTGGSDAIGARSPSSNWYFAEGNTLSNFDQYVTVLNPGNATAKLTFHYMVEGQGEKVTTGSVEAHSRATFKTRDQIGSNLNASLYLSSSQSVVAERPMYFDYNTWTGGHDVVGANSPANAWYFAEGTTRDNFNEWLCLQNPGKSKITVKARYQLGSGQGKPISKTYTVPAKQRLTVLVNSEIGGNKDNSVQLTSDSLFIAERPMYFDYNGWTGGHDVLGANSPATTWSFAEGTTRDNFNEWLCLQNPGGNDAHAVITYYTTSGQAIKKTRTVEANSRLTVNVNESAGANLDISAKVTSDRPIIVERPMYFNYNGWTGGHDVVGLTQ